jgi:putative addiction module killer protein
LILKRWVDLQLSFDFLYGIPYSQGVRLRVLKTEAFEIWFDNLDSLTQKKVTARIRMFSETGHPGLVNRFSGITELKWKDGLRVYTVLSNPTIIVLLGGNKNGQEKDIRRAQKILSQID